MLLIFFGHIGAGKTSIAKQVARILNYEVICFDDIVKSLYDADKIYGKSDDFLLTLEETQNVYDNMHKIASDALRENQGVILESMYFKKQRDEAIAIAKHYEVPYKLIEITCDEKVIRERLTKRKKQDDKTPGFELYLKYKDMLESEIEPYATIDTTNKSVEETAREVTTNLDQI